MNMANRMTQALPHTWETLSAASKSEFMTTPDITLLRGDLVDLIPRIAARLDAIGGQEGDRVFIRTQDEGCAVACFVTCLLDGFVPVMVSPDTPDEKVTHILALTEAKIAVVDQGASSPDVPTGTACLTISDASPARRKLSLRKPGARDVITARLGLTTDARRPRLPRDPNGLAYLLFTSGTTSNPAGVMINRGALTANVATIAQVLEIDATARVFNDMVLSHADGLVQGPMLALFTGCGLIRSGGFSVGQVEAWLNRVRSCRATHFIAVPTVWALIDRYCEHEDYFDAPEFRYLGSVASAMPQELWERIERRFGKPLISQYGLTETVTSALYAGAAPGAGARFGAGVPIDCTAKLDRIEGSDMGELLLRGENIFDGYWKNPQRTKETLTKDGWLRTGDVARQLENGNYEICGRIKTAIVSGGYLIRPEEVDDALLKHPDVREAVTVGLPHADFGEIAVSAVVCDGSGPAEDDLRAFAATLLEPLKIPRRFVTVDQIPRGDAGKPRLDAVRALLSEKTTGPQFDASSGETDVDDRLLELAANVFFVTPDELSMSSDPESVAGWDSFTHVALILAIEEAFDIRIPTRQAAALRRLGDAADAVRHALG